MRLSTHDGSVSLHTLEAKSTVAVVKVVTLGHEQTMWVDIQQALDLRAQLDAFLGKAKAEEPVISQEVAG